MGAEVDRDTAFFDLNRIVRLTETGGWDRGAVAGVTELLGRVDPIELALVCLARADQVKGIPADLVIVAKVLQDDVLATADEVCVLDRAVLSNLLRDDVDPTSFEGVVA